MQLILAVVVLQLCSSFSTAGLSASRRFSFDFTKASSNLVVSVNSTATVDDYTRRYLELNSSCSPNLAICCELRLLQGASSGVYLVRDREVVCNSDGWMVMQRSLLTSGSGAFLRGWTDYERGFGDAEGDFWLGLEMLHNLTNTWKTELQVNLFTNNGQMSFAHYDKFVVGNALSNYTLSVSGFEGTVPDRLSEHNGAQFSTYDRDNDRSDHLWCARLSAVGLVGWWYTPLCGPVYINVRINDGHSYAHWGSLFSRVEMKIRSRHFMCGGNQ